MTKEERHNAILEQLLKTDAILVSDLSDRLQVSSVTIRKDLTDLEKAGKLYRSHGKAIAINPFAGNRTVNEKEKLYPEEKYNIGMEAAKFIEPNDSIILASGTTIHAFAHCIKPAHKLTVVSASLQASIALSQEDNIDIIQLGGTTTDMREAHLNQQMMKAAQKTIVLADASKFGRRGFAKISNMEDVDVIITDAHIKAMDKLRIEEMGIELVIVGAEA